MTTLPSLSRFNDEEIAFLKLSDDEMREQARDLHEMDCVIEIDEGAQVIRPTVPGECARIAAWIRLGPGDWTLADQSPAAGAGSIPEAISH
jgi:hypothetical protein